ncbi:hypothetical protein ACSSVV_003883 [Marinobacter sp. MBR-105]
MSEAMDGRREAHMDVLVAVFGKYLLVPTLAPNHKNRNSKT